MNNIFFPKGVRFIFFKKINLTPYFFKKIIFGNKKLINRININNSIDQVKKCGKRFNSSAIQDIKNTREISVK